MREEFSQQTKTIDPDDLVPLNAFSGEAPVSVDMVYSDPSHKRNMFDDLYHPEAQILWAHKDLAVVTLLAAKVCRELYGWTFKINDCFRPIEAQEAMAQKGFDPSLVSLPGTGAHPRAMAIDIEPLYAHGGVVPLGVPFDYFAKNPDKTNPAARDHNGEGWYFGGRLEIVRDRMALENSMTMSGETFGLPIKPLPDEVWDFRFEDDLVNSFKPMSDLDVHPYQRVMNPDVKGVEAILSGDYPLSVLRVIEDVRERTNDAFSKINFEKRGNEHFFCDQNGNNLLPKEEYQPPPAPRPESLKL